MNLYHSNNIGNVAVLGHLGSGKTSVIEASGERVCYIRKDVAEEYFINICENMSKLYQTIKTDHCRHSHRRALDA